MPATPRAAPCAAGASSDSARPGPIRGRAICDLFLEAGPPRARRGRPYSARARARCLRARHTRLLRATARLPSWPCARKPCSAPLLLASRVESVYGAAASRFKRARPSGGPPRPPPAPARGEGRRAGSQQPLKRRPLGAAPGRARAAHNSARLGRRRGAPPVPPAARARAPFGPLGRRRPGPRRAGTLCQGARGVTPPSPVVPSPSSPRPPSASTALRRCCAGAPPRGRHRRRPADRYRLRAPVCCSPRLLRLPTVSVAVLCNQSRSNPEAGWRGYNG